MVDVKLEDIMTATKDGFASISTKQAKLDEELKNAARRMDDMETKLNRPPMPSNTPSIAPEVKAFGNYLKKGKDILSPDEVKLLSTDVDTQGGYLVPTVLRNQLIEQIVLISPIRSLASVASINGNVLEIPKENGGAFTAGWVAEQGARTAEATTTFGKYSIPLNEMYAKPKATQTMLDDATLNVEGYIMRKVAEQMAKLEGAAYVSGTGVGQPEGLLTATVSDINSGNANTIVSTDPFIDMFYSLNEMYTRNAVWLMARGTKPYLFKLKDATGNYIFNRAITATMPDLLLGKPIIEVPDMPAVAGGNFPIIFGDIGQAYQIVDKTTVGMLRDPYSSKPYVEFYTTRRTGGQVVKADAIVKLHISA
jgi:HK97 family phage major capsid protein